MQKPSVVTAVARHGRPRFVAALQMRLKQASIVTEA
jgi:hypothetical protein